ncbi:hypothetical protein [Chitinophaga sp.]|uniref:hypothetical protein n=1 Tax=Chitinophaga sp. TaxID=1869181 RepID=UPI002F946771
MRPVNKISPHIQQLQQQNGPVKTSTVTNALIDTIGNYCSYCEMMLSGYHVEHLRYTATWPENVNVSMWDDLLLICNDCRNNIRVPELNTLSADALLWPDRDMSFNLYNSPLQYELRPVKYVVVNTDGDRILEQEMELVFVVANPAAAATLYQKAFNTINHFQLNMQLEYYDAATNELRIPETVHLQHADNRMFKRTKAWHEAMRAVEGLRGMDSLPDKSENHSALRQMLVDQIAMTAWYSGNWSVWMTVLHQQTNDAALTQSVLLSTAHPFPGTRNENNRLFIAE